ncbi:hypothetical protein E2562_023308 [Oryza meyeriana var. granulata]|uniref:Uncharacterized protein n=1 Tax=Oryza meyeriana var. granulata TaxID=110450 RepID=A0A6G1DL94_9ORYZ|nr:hypothetical protein E2562_023308 [Oryza meyeriana var. granulata]
MDREVTSLSEVKQLINTHGHTPDTGVRVTSLSRIRDATRRRCGGCSASRSMRWAGRSTPTAWRISIPWSASTASSPSPTPSSTRSSPSSPPLTSTSAPLPLPLPSPPTSRGPTFYASPSDLVDLAGRILRGQAQSHDDDDDSGGLELPFTTRLLDAGTKLRNVHLGCVSVEEIVHLLGELLEEVAAAIVTERHPRPTMMEYLLQAKDLMKERMNSRCCEVEPISRDTDNDDETGFES